MAPITSALNRVAVELTGDWRHIPDPFDNGSVSHLSLPLTDGWFLDRERQSPSERIEYSFDSAAPLAVPGDWNSQREELFFYEGTLWYRTTFEFLPERGKRQFLYFGAVNRHADVWLNGTHLGSHHVGFTPFAFEATEALRAGENSVVVRVNNARRAEDVPAMRTDWWNYGGITREVALLETPETFIRSWEFKLNADGSSVLASVQLDGPDAAGAECTVSMGTIALERTLTTDDSGLGTFEAGWPADAELWDPENPALHAVSIVSETDRATDRIGFRTVATQDREILLNGKPIFLRGICLHEEALDRPGRAWSEPDARELLGRAKDLGCNYVRLAHYTHNEHMVRVADELGLLIWAEIPVYWVLDFESEVTKTYAKRHLVEMIERDRNRASIMIWSVGNENEGNEPQTELRRVLAETARELDDSRLISAACFVRMTRGDDGKLDGVFVDQDPFGNIADILAINEYIGWYHDHTDQLEGLALSTGWEKPLIFSEFGAGVKQGLRGSSDEIWTEDFGVKFYQDQLAWCDELREAGILQGLSPWILKDFRSPRRPLGGIQDWYNRKGLLSEDGEPKLVFEVVREQYEVWAAEDAH